MNNILDCRGLACPQPVLRTRSHIADHRPERFAVIVDNAAACENVTRFMKTQHYTVRQEAQDGEWRLEATLAADAPQQAAVPSAEEAAAAVVCPIGSAKTLVVIPSDVFGSGDDKLGTSLMKNFLLTLPELGSDLWRIILLNGGVKLTVAGSPVLEQLQALEQQGVSILVCGSCLEFFGLQDKKQVGETTNMLDVVTSMQLADKVLRV